MDELSISWSSLEHATGSVMAVAATHAAGPPACPRTRTTTYALRTRAKANAAISVQRTSARPCHGRPGALISVMTQPSSACAYVEYVLVRELVHVGLVHVGGTRDGSVPQPQ